jgi:hypothetical protein
MGINEEFKHPEWVFINSLSYEGEDVLLSGFTEFGSIGTKDPVGIEDGLEVLFNFKMTGIQSDHAAILDLDFNQTLKPYASLFYVDGCLAFGVKDGGNTKTIWVSLGDFVDTRWHKCRVTVKDSLVTLYIDEIKRCKYKYEEELLIAKVFLGNNNVKDMGFYENKNISFIASDIILKSSYGEITLDPKLIKKDTMAYSRFWDSDIYIYPSVDGDIVCAACILSESSFHIDNDADVVSHINAHREAGHNVPEGLAEDILHDPERFGVYSPREQRALSFKVEWEERANDLVNQFNITRAQADLIMQAYPIMIDQDRAAKKLVD